MDPKKAAAAFGGGKKKQKGPKGGDGGKGGDKGGGHKPSVPAHEQPEEGDDEGGEGHESDAEIVARVGGEVQDGNVDPQIEKLMAEYEPPDPPEWAPDAETWHRAVDAVDPDKEGDSVFDDPWLVTAHVYKAMGGEVDEHEKEEQGGKPHKEPDGDEEGEEAEGGAY